MMKTFNSARLLQAPPPHVFGEPGMNADRQPVLCSPVDMVVRQDKFGLHRFSFYHAQKLLSTNATKTK